MFGFLGGAVAKAIFGQAFSAIEAAYHDYLNKKISEDEYATRRAAIAAEMTQGLASAGVDFFKAYVEALKVSPALRAAHAIATYATLFVFLWFAWVQPFGLALAGCDVHDSAALAACRFPALIVGPKLMEYDMGLLAGLLGLAPWLHRPIPK